jgi:O-acetyl-ADP-ribose deacetylase (regulator of RNase III)
VDGMIHRAAGPELQRECMTLHGCETGKAKLTKGYRLPCKYIIHTVGPVWQGGGYGERALLESCYRSSLELAQSHGCESVAFPLISSGIFGYPKAEALTVATETISSFLAEHGDMTVYLTVYGRGSYLISAELFDDVKSYIDDRYVAAHTDTDAEKSRSLFDTCSFSIPPDYDAPHAAAAAQSVRERRSFGLFKRKDAASSASAAALGGNAARRDEETYFALADDACAPSICGSSLEDALRQLDESFSQMLLRKIDESGMTDAQCYKKANIDRKLFSKIRSDVGYKPSKATALAFAVALELPLAETEELLKKAGYALSRSSKFDIIVEYFISRRQYDIYRINETLFSFDQALLGSVG